MPSFTSFDGTTLAYADEGNGRPVILLHSMGFAARLWEGMGVTAALHDAGFRSIALDQRGHGASDKPHEASAFADNAMARDVSALADHLELESFDLVCYSMGSHIGLRVLQIEPRIRAAVLGGLSGGATRGAGMAPQETLDQLRTDDIDALPENAQPGHRRIERWGADRRSLAAMLSIKYVEPEADFTHINARVLILNGTADEANSPTDALLEQLSNGTRKIVEATHATTMDHPDFIPSIVGFLT